jgi:hypothetical protein
MKAGEEALIYQKQNASRLNDIQDKVDKLISESQLQQERIDVLTSEKDVIQSQLKKAEQDHKSLKGELDNSNREKGKQAKLIKLYQERDILILKQKEIDERILEMEKTMQDSVSYLSFYVRLLIVALVLVFLIFAVLNFCYDWTDDWLSVVLGIPSLIIALTQTKVFTPRVLKDQIKKEQEDYWQAHHPEYEIALNEKEKLNSKYCQINESISYFTQK